MNYGLTSAFAEEDARRPSQAYSILIDYNARRPSSDPMYLQKAVGPHFQQRSMAYDRQNGHMNYGVSAISQPRATLEATPPTNHEFGPHKAFEISTYNPERGTEGTRISVYLQSSGDFTTHTPPTAHLMFASRSVPAVWTRLDAGEQYTCCNYMICAAAPAFSETGSSNSSVPLRLQLQHQSRPDASPIDIGDWLYEDDTQLEVRLSPREAFRKRKLTDEPPYTSEGNHVLQDYQMQLMLLEQQNKKRLLTARQEQDTMLSVVPKRGMPGAPAKHTTLLEQQPTQSQGHGSYTYPTASLAYPQSLDFSNMQRRYTSYGRSQLQRSLPDETSTLASQGLIGATSTAHSSMGQSRDQTSSWNSPYVAEFQSGSNLHPNTATAFQLSPTLSPSSGNPRLIRPIVRSTLRQQPTPSPTIAGSPPDCGSDPANLIKLEICGNVKAMQDNWTPEERAVKRRVVRFWREQNWTTITVWFQPLRPDERSLPYERNELRISCLYWEEGKEGEEEEDGEKEEKYYLTSVDTIFLLEFVLGKTPFETDEKNRIRRNLEYLNPCTISREKPRNEDFFDLIMGFTNPKPTKIKKSVKVFQWGKLEEGLNKILSKYVCSNSLVEATRVTDLYQAGDPSSIAGTIHQQPTPDSSGAQSEAGASPAYAQTPNSSTLSPPAAPHGLPSYQQSSPLPDVSAVTLANSYPVPALAPQHIPNNTFHSPYAPQVSIPDLSSAYGAPNIGRGRSSQAPTEDLLASTSDYYSGRPPHTNAYFAGQYAPQGLSEATATLGLPGRASEDLSAYFDTDVTSSSGDAQYRRRHSDVDDEAEGMRFKEE